MTITDKQRTGVHNCLRDLMGQEMADIMMELLPPVGWGEVVRRQDMNGLGVSLRAEMSETRSDLQREIQAVRHELKAEIQQVRTELKAEIQEVRAELKAEIQEVRAELATFREVTNSRLDSLEKGINSLKSTITTLIGCNVAMFGLVLTLMWQGR